MHIELILAGLLLLAFCLDRWFAQKRSRESLFAAYIADGSFANHPVPVLVYDWDSLVIVDANAAAHHQYGYDDGALMGRKIRSLRRSCDVEAFHQKRGQLQSTPGASGLAGEWIHVRADGTEINVSVTYQIFRALRPEVVS